MELPNGSGWGVALLGALFGGGGFWAWLAERRKTTRSSPAQQVSADAEMVEAIGRFSQQFGEASGGLFDHFRRELKFVREQVVGLETKINACETRHAECEASVRDLNARLDLSERDRAALRGRIDRLMGDHPPADYGPTLIAGLVPIRANPEEEPNS